MRASSAAMRSVPGRVASAALAANDRRACPSQAAGGALVAASASARTILSGAPTTAKISAAPRLVHCCPCTYVATYVGTRKKNPPGRSDAHDDYMYY
jgi:hypothetical protein